MRSPNAQRARKCSLHYFEKVLAVLWGVLGKACWLPVGRHMTSCSAPVFLLFRLCFSLVFLTVCIPPPPPQFWSRCWARTIKKSKRTESWFHVLPLCLDSVCASLTHSPKLLPQPQTVLLFDPQCNPPEGSRATRRRVWLKCLGKMTMRNPEEPRPSSRPSLSKPGNVVDFSHGSSKKNKT